MTSLASGSSGNCYILRSTKAARPLLIDVGVAPQAIRQSLGEPLPNLAACLISHAHGDHSKYAVELADRGVMIAMSVEAMAEMDKTRAAKKSKNWPLRSRRLVQDRPWSVFGWGISILPLPHDAAGTVAFYITDGEDRYFHATDCMYLPAIPDRPTIMAVEANHDTEILKGKLMSGGVNAAVGSRALRSHMSIETLIKALEMIDLSECKEIHLLHLSNSNSNEAEFKARVQAKTGIPTYIAGAR